MVLLAVESVESARDAIVVAPKNEGPTTDLSREEVYNLLKRLLNLFPSENGNLSAKNFRFVTGVDLPAPYNELLNHEEHLTGVMERRHGGASVKVLESRCLTDSLYCRRILLQAPCGKAVLFAILLANLNNLPEAVRIGVQEEKIPVGRFGS